MNSSIVNFVLKSIAGGGKNFGTPKLVENTIAIRKYNPNNEIHRKLCELSKKAHELAKYGEDSELKKVEEEIDRTVAQYFGLSDDELKAIKIGLAVLRGEEVEEEEIVETPKEVSIEFTKTHLLPYICDFIDVTVVNPNKRKVVIEVALPLGEALSVSTNKEEDILRIRLPALDPGSYKAPYRVLIDGKVAKEAELILHVRKIPRFRR